MEQSSSSRSSLMVRWLTGLLRIYQGFSSYGSRRCRFYPTCSEYMRESLLVMGFWRGTSQGILRILRCHPWNPGGVDMVKVPHGK